MMEGPERDTLDEAVWGPGVSECFEATVSPGDALFIPKGWWHSIKSIGTDITASVNWWFR
jgi:ribosomal protein L16 Arg81 hydroxylase